MRASPFYETLPEYINAVEKYSKLGLIKTFKFHVWGNFDQDKKSNPKNQ